MTTAMFVAAVNQMLGSGLTNLPIDNARAVLALRSARDEYERGVIMSIVIEKRATHRTWTTLTQRQWQAHQRTVTPRTCAIRKARWGNKHDDTTILRAELESVATREKYVRC